MISTFKKYEQQLSSKGLEAEFIPVNDHLVTIGIIGIPKRLQGKGYGTTIMNNLCKMADQNGVMLQLVPAASSTHSRTKLIRFYSKFGFVQNKGDNKQTTYSAGMYRVSKRQLQESLLLEKKSTYSYGCTMLNVSFDPIKKLHKQIDKSDLYEEKDNDKYGLEKESHLTLFYGSHKEVTLNQIKEVLSEFEFPKEIKSDKISLFEQDDYDVLKIDFSIPVLTKINKELKKFPYTSKYKDYKQHLTIAYVKKGLGKKYVYMFKDEESKFNVEDCTYSQSDGKKSKIKIKIKKSLSESKEVDIDRLPEFVAKIKQLARKYEAKGCIIDIHFRQEFSIQLGKILVPKEKRNENIGTKFMTDLTSLADDFGIIISLSASNSFGSNLTRLTKFYQRFGFRKNTGRKADHRFSDNMIREPKDI